ncbi:hypothetical protein N7468_004548 [Penicillium chermesinum]|uniref:Sigma-70 region 2 family protein n=1 Tax=Penicillium chermesinum TaxID=63820 RepID=A0A9W9P8I1_9EURO|nr:uncharacterized protein N7468_004548 [Penicillium chermesinum]KAJ5239929.1 hypothetical protein N7468_004548 [Penicillium chermesinum]
MSVSREEGSKSRSETPQRWQFIDSSKNSRSNLTQVKRHVMQEYMRQKKGGPHQSEDESETTPRRKRGRPRKTDSKPREPTRQPATSGSSSSPLKLAPNPDSSGPSEEDALADLDQVVHAMGPLVPAQPTKLDTYERTLPFRPPVQHSGSVPEESRVQFSFVDITPASLDTPYNMSVDPASSSVDLQLSPRTIMSAARRDPFNALPLELNEEGHRLFDFYVNDMPACSYGGHYRSKKAHNWYTMVFVPEAMKGGVAFQNTILVHAANTWAWLRNEVETTRTLLYRDRALTMLREHLQNDPYDNSDVSIISCLSAAALEDFDPRPGHKEISWMHMRAARNMIRLYPIRLRDTRGQLLLRSIRSHCHSQKRTFSPPSSHPFHNMPSPPSSVDSPPSDAASFPLPEAGPPAPIPSTQGTPIDEIRLQCEEFLHFLRRCEHLALYQRDHPETCVPARSTTVHETSILYRVIAAPPIARSTKSGDRKQMIARLAALIMLNAGLWDYRYTPTLAGSFLTTLEQAMIDSEVSMSGSVEAILQILLECNDGLGPELFDHSALEPLPDYSQYAPNDASPYSRPWFVGRMLKIAKRLSAESWYRVNSMLFACLTLQACELSFCLWEPDLRREILDAPLTNYVMPSLL